MEKRLDKIRKILRANSLDAILISHPANLVYLTSQPFLLEEREGFIIVTKNDAFGIFSPLNREEVKKRAPFLKFLEYTTTESRKFSNQIKDIFQKHSLKKIGFEENNLTFFEYKVLQTPNTSLIPISLHNLRSIKDKFEIDLIQQACQVGDKAFSYILKKIKPGMTEKEVGFLLEMFIKEKGANISFSPIVAFGPGSAVPHHMTGELKLKRNDVILIDFGVKNENYCSDMTRTFFIGKPTDREIKIYETVKKAQEHSFAYLKNGLNNKTALIDQQARNYIIRNGYSDFPHSSHGIGIEVHETPNLSPKSEDIIQAGMVFSVEPGIYFPDFMGVRIEDIVAMTDNGPEILTKSSRELIVL